MRISFFLSAAGLAGLAMAATASDARACGGCFHGPTQNGDVITDHRMIFRVTPQQTTLYDEIEYSGSPAGFAWVLPIHGPVTVGLSSDIVFASLDAVTQTTIEAPNLPACPSCTCAEDLSGGTPAASADAGVGHGGGVTVISQQTVGPYDTVQLQSSKPHALNTWLSANGFAVPADVQPIIDAYVKEGFDFLALKLAPGQGVSAMRPVRVTAPGAGMALPLRMVAAGTGPTVGITLWILADGRLEPTNFPTFTIGGSDLVWDWKAQLSNYTTVRTQKEAAQSYAAWQVESSLELSPYQVESPVLADSAGQDYLDVPASDAGDAGAGLTADQARQQDLSTLFPNGNQGTVRVTRIRADLARAALAADLELGAPADQSELSNQIRVTQSVNAPACPAIPDPCPPCSVGGNPPGFPFSGSSSGGTMTGGKGGTSGCSTAPSSEGAGAGIELGLAGLLGIAVLGKRRRR